MASATTALARPARRTGYRHVLVPVTGAGSERAMEIACALADEHAAITVVVVIEVSPLLPLDARMDDDEAEARRALLRAEAVADEFGVGIGRRTVRAREAGPAIVELAERTGAEVVVLAAERRRRPYGRRTFGSTVRHVLAKAPCPVLVVTPPAG